MALLWQKKTKNTLYEVRSAGNTVRLYSNSVFHSQWNSRRPVNGDIWDLLFLPIFFYEDIKKIKNVLVLGVGGGAVINQLNSFFDHLFIQGIELDKNHINVAKSWFKVDSEKVNLVCADASVWVTQKHQKTDKFDLIIEDIFSSSTQGPSRAICADKYWFDALVKLLTPQGLLVMNFESYKQFKNSELTQIAKNSKLINGVFYFSHAKYENCIGVYCRNAARISAFNKSLKQFPQLDRNRKTCRLDFRLARLR